MTASTSSFVGGAPEDADFCCCGGGAGVPPALCVFELELAEPAGGGNTEAAVAIVVVVDDDTDPDVEGMGGATAVDSAGNGERVVNNGADAGGGAATLVVRRSTEFRVQFFLFFSKKRTDRKAAIKSYIFLPVINGDGNVDGLEGGWRRGWRRKGPRLVALLPAFWQSLHSTHQSFSQFSIRHLPPHLSYPAHPSMHFGGFVSSNNCDGGQRRAAGAGGSTRRTSGDQGVGEGQEGIAARDVRPGTANANPLDPVIHGLGPSSHPLQAR
ncbi:hypothetical protein SCHPADRAFT_890472 [Schizopora paradoxa]|uniref:Uncharacterized protein n=1 Tax=Schizopora paradoxa TaxID=27342 RepID=A0A0H2RMW4_9AGAM|nr:hypothetical protein SCHPADRAFT_890472 [Schizopora paradoxa]